MCYIFRIEVHWPELCSPKRQLALDMHATPMRTVHEGSIFDNILVCDSLDFAKSEAAKLQEIRVESCASTKRHGVANVLQ